MDFLSYQVAVLRRFPNALGRRSDLLTQATRVAAEGAGLAIVLGMCIGIVAWLHAGKMLNRFEASAWMPTVLMTSVVLEFGPISVGLILASRLAAGLAAEIGAMAVSEQVEAMRLLGVCPLSRLVAPRVLATLLMVIPLTILVDYSALFGGLFAEWFAGDLSWRLFVRQGMENLHFTETCLATGKTLVFGFLVSTIACWHGLQTQSDTAAVGIAATRAVFWSTLAVLIANVLLVQWIQWIA